MIDWFDPAYKAGGPIASIINFCQAMGEKYDLFILTSDHDLSLHEKLPVVTDNWIRWKSMANVWYSNRKITRAFLKSLIMEIKPNVLYLNGVFSFQYSLVPLWVSYAWRNDLKVIINPRGMLFSDALKVKYLKKRVFLALVKRHPVWKSVTWQHASKEEEHCSKKIFGHDIKSVIAGNFLPATQKFQKIAKQAGELRLIFIGRIHPIKNPLVLLNFLNDLVGKVILNIYGPIEDQEYYQNCFEVAQRLPGNIKVSFQGPCHRRKVPELIQEHHFLVLPSKSENFAHAIAESWTAGRPVLISKNTPWHDLDKKGIGWDIDLTKFSSQLNEMLLMNDDCYEKLCIQSRDYALELQKNAEVIETYHLLLASE